jgi:hypothetical protein
VLDELDELDEADEVDEVEALVPPAPDEAFVDDDEETAVACPPAPVDEVPDPHAATAVSATPNALARSQRRILPRYHTVSVKTGIASNASGLVASRHPRYFHGRRDDRGTDPRR